MDNSMDRCPVCGHDGERELVEGLGDYTLYRCLDCDVVFSIPFRGPGAQWYEGSDLYTLGRFITDAPEWYHREFLSVCTGRRDILDVGCGTGVFVREARRYGHRVWGIDFDPANIKIARERFGLEDVYCFSVEELKERFNRRFDVVTFFEVLEHLERPGKFIEDVKTVLTRDGIIGLSVPNRERILDTIGQGDSPPNHLTRWNSTSIRRFLEDHGFEVTGLRIKPIGTEEIEKYLKMRIRLRIAHGLARSGIEEGSADKIKRARVLMNIKDVVFRALSLPVGLVLRPFNLQGGNILCTARLRDGR